MWPKHFHLWNKPLTEREARGEIEPDQLIEGWIGLGERYEDEGQPDDAVRAYRKTLELKRQHLGASHPATLEEVRNLVALLSELGRSEEARALSGDLGETPSEQAVQSQEVWDFPSMGPDEVEEPPSAPSTPVESYYELQEEVGRLLGQGDFETALPLMERLIPLAERKLGLEDPSLALLLHGLGSIYSNFGRHDEAVAACERAVAIATKTLGADNEYTRAFTDNLALSRRRQAEADLAVAPVGEGELVQLLDHAMGLVRKALEKESASLVESLERLYEFCKTTGQIADVLPNLVSVTDTTGFVLGREHPDYLALKQAVEACQRSAGH